MAGRHSLLALAAGIAAAAVMADAAFAQNSLGLGRSEQAITPDGVFAPILLWIKNQQQDFYALMRDELKAMRQDGAHVWTLVALSFVYGVFHAAGPGHGKAVISTYMIANEVAARRGMSLSFAAAFLQAASAIVLVSAFVVLLRGSGIRQSDAAGWLEVASYAAVTALGAWLLWSKLLRGGREVHAGHANEDGHNHAHHRDRQSRVECGHLHAPDPAILAGRFGLRQAGSAILAVGLRPCSGALIVLTFAFLNGLYFAGVAATIAMALGTGLTVAVLAALAVWAKDAAIALGGTAGKAAEIHRVAEITGAGLVFLLGLTLLSASLY